MTTTNLEDIITKKQSPSNQAYFASRLSQCFSLATGPSWLDVRIGDALLRESMASVSASSVPITSQLDAELPLFSVAAMPYFRIESELELRDLLQSHNGAMMKMFFVRQRNSASRLSINWRLFDILCQQCDVFERIRDYVMCFGLRNGESEVTPPALHYRILWQNSSQQVVGLECAYALRFVELNNLQQRNPWSIRQTGVYFNCQSSMSTWLFITLSSTAEAELHKPRPSWPDKSHQDSFEIHYILFNVAVGSWRRFIVYLANEIRQQADKAIIADLEVEGEVLTRFEERQYLKQLEDSVTDLISALSFMLENVDALTGCYRSFQSQLPRAISTEQNSVLRVNKILKGFKDRRRELERFSSQAEALRRKVDSASNLVSNILDLNNGHALRMLALESRTENANMAVLTRKSVQDAAMVKVLTIVTLVYLPVTVVTNFFSTQFVNSAEASDGSNHLVVRRETWILFAVSAPLTLLTIYIWWMFAQREVQGHFPGHLPNHWKRLTGKLKVDSKTT